MNVYEVNDIGHSKILLIFVSILSSCFPASQNHLCSRGQFCVLLLLYSNVTAHSLHSPFLWSSLHSSAPASHEDFTAAAIGLSGILLE